MGELRLVRQALAVKEGHLKANMLVYGRLELKMTKVQCGLAKAERFTHDFSKFLVPSIHR